MGLVLAGVFLRDKTLVYRMRSIAFAMFTPFYFIRAGLYVSLPALWPAFAIVAGLLLLKMLTKTVGVWPLARMHFMSKREATYTTLLMATGLTFGTISALFGFQNKIIDQRQHHPRDRSHLSAFVPTLFAQKFFSRRKTRCTPLGVVMSIAGLFCFVAKSAKLARLVIEVSRGISHCPSQ